MNKNNKHCDCHFIKFMKNNNQYNHNYHNKYCNRNNHNQITTIKKLPKNNKEIISLLTRLEKLSHENDHNDNDYDDQREQELDLNQKFSEINNQMGNLYNNSDPDDESSGIPNEAYYFKDEGEDEYLEQPPQNNKGKKIKQPNVNQFENGYGRVDDHPEEDENDENEDNDNNEDENQFDVEEESNGYDDQNQEEENEIKFDVEDVYDNQNQEEENEDQFDVEDVYDDQNQENEDQNQENQNDQNQFDAEDGHDDQNEENNDFPGNFDDRYSNNGYDDYNGFIASSGTDDTKLFTPKELEQLNGGEIAFTGGSQRKRILNANAHQSKKKGGSGNDREVLAKALEVEFKNKLPDTRFVSKNARKTSNITRLIIGANGVNAPSVSKNKQSGGAPFMTINTFLIKMGRPELIEKLNIHQVDQQ